MSHYFKRKQVTETPAKPSRCGRCHERFGTVRLDGIALDAGPSSGVRLRDLWFCDACLDAMGRSKPRNS